MKAKNGQVALYLVLVLVAITILVTMNVGVFLSVRTKNRAMNAGDAASLAASRVQGELLNEIGSLNVEHLKAALANDETECQRIEAEQARRCFLGPLDGIDAGNAAARDNGAEPSDEMRDILKQHVIDIRTMYVTTPDMYPSPWEGAWEEYAAALESKIGGALYAGPDNILFMDEAGGHLLLNKAFYDAIAASNWCWFRFNAESLLSDYSGFGDWGPLPTADDETRRRRSANSEVYSLHLVPKTGSAVDLLGTNLVCRLTGASPEDLANSFVITNRSETWYFYDADADWRDWWEIDLDCEWQFPVVGLVKPEYDVRGAAAICRVRMKYPTMLESGDDERTAEWVAAAKPFGTVENERGETDVVTSNRLFVTSAFAATRLVPIDTVGGNDLSTADAEWMRHVREDLGDYLRNGPRADRNCFYCRQLVTWERASFRRQGATWLKYNAKDCIRPTGGGSARGGARHGH